MTSALDRLEEKGVIRRVRTPAGARRFGQPIGTVITRDMMGGLGGKRKKRRQARTEKVKARVKKASNSTSTVDMARGKAASPTPGVPKGAAARLHKKGILPEPRDHGTGTWSQFGSDGVNNINIMSERGKVTADIVIGPARKKFTGTDYDEVREKAAKWLEANHKRMSTPGDDYDEFGMWPVNRAPRDYDALPEIHQGIRGRDWWNEGDPDWDSGEEWDRWDLIELESNDLGVKLDHNAADMDPEFAMAVMGVLRAHEEMYPGLMKYLEKIEVGPPKGRAMGWNGPTYAETGDGKYGVVSRIGFPSQYAGYQSGGHTALASAHSAGMPYRNIPEWRVNKLPKDYRSSGWMAVTKEDVDDAFPDLPEDEKWRGPLSYVVTHEVGHMMGFMMMNDLPVNYEKRDEWEPKRKEFMQEFLNLLEEYAILKDANVENPEMVSRNTGKMIDTQAVFEHLSEYGGTNFHEIVAESWAGYQMDENPGDFVRAMGELLEDVMAEYLDTREY